MGVGPTGSEPAISIVPANHSSWSDLQTVFGTRGAASRCQCQRYKLRPGEAFERFPVEERAARLRRQTGCGDPASAGTSGLVAYLGGEQGVFADAGFVEVGRPSPRRAVMRIDP